VDTEIGDWRRVRSRRRGRAVTPAANVGAGDVGAAPGEEALGRATSSSSSARSPPPVEKPPPRPSSSEKCQAPAATERSSTLWVPAELDTRSPLAQGSQFAIDVRQPPLPLRRSGSHPLLSGTAPSAEVDAASPSGDFLSGSCSALRHAAASAAVADLPRIEQVARGWQASVWAAEACADADSSGADMWHSRRNENASWRLWFLEQERDRRGLSVATASTTVLAQAQPDEQLCFKCAGGSQVGRICTCHPNPFMPPVQTSSGSRPASGSAGHASSAGDSSGSTAAWSGTDQLLAECFRRPPGLELESIGSEDVGNGPKTPWGRLLRGHQASAAAFCSANSHAKLTARRRNENAAWRHWWAAHQRGEVGDAHSDLPADFFPPTPTSTYPGTPRRGSFSEEPPGFGGLSAFGGVIGGGPSASSQLLGCPVPGASPVVYFPVPVHLAVHVQQFLEALLAHPLEPPLTELPMPGGIWNLPPEAAAPPPLMTGQLAAELPTSSVVQPPLPVTPSMHS